MGVSLIWKKKNRGEKIWKKGTHTRGRHWIWSRCVHHTSAMIHTINIGLTHERQSNSPRRRRRRFCRKVFYVTVRLWLACCEKLVLHLILNTKACFHFPSLSPLVPYIAKQCLKKKKKTPLLDVYSSGQLSIHWDKRTSEWRTARRTCIRNRRLQSKEFGLAFIHLTLSLSLFFKFLFLCVCVFHTNFGAIAIDLTPTLSLYSCTTVQPTRFRCQNCTTAKQINVSSSVRIVAPSFSPNCQSCNERRRAYRLCFSPNSMSVAISRRSFLFLFSLVTS